MRQRVWRRAFSLIEMVVVMAIISVLAGLLLGAVQRVRAMGQATQTKFEMSQLAIESGIFKEKLHSTPMVWGGGPQGQFRLCSTYVDNNGNILMDASTKQPWPEITFLKRCWPNINLSDNGLRSSGVADNSLVPPTAPILLDCNQAYMFWMTGLNYMDYRGFATNPAQPFQPYPPSGASRIGPFMQIQQNRLTDPTTGKVDNRYRDVWGTPYCFMAFDDGMNAYPCPYSATVNPVGQYVSLFNNVKYTPGNGGAVFNVVPYLYQAANNPNQVPFLAGWVQIISAGPNGEFGPGGLLVSGNGGLAGNDDLSNFQMNQLGSPE